VFKRGSVNAAPGARLKETGAQMSQLVPHLLLRADAGGSNASALLRNAGYQVTNISNDVVAERTAGVPEVDGVIVELPAIAAIAVARRIEARYGHKVVVLVITPAVEAVHRVLPSTPVVSPAEVDDDLISTIDLALVDHQFQSVN
jgi:response regulator RpfG family c-di-GMP phosphodiesterase